VKDRRVRQAASDIINASADREVARREKLAELGERVLGTLREVDFRTDLKPDPVRLWRAEAIGQDAYRAARSLGLLPEVPR
jgi:hypothetical protein